MPFINMTGLSDLDEAVLRSNYQRVIINCSDNSFGAAGMVDGLIEEWSAEDPLEPNSAYPEVAYYQANDRMALDVIKKLEIQSFPTVLFYRDGEMEWAVAGGPEQVEKVMREFIRE